MELCPDSGMMIMARIDWRKARKFAGSVSKSDTADSLLADRWLASAGNWGNSSVEHRVATDSGVARASTTTSRSEIPHVTGHGYLITCHGCGYRAEISSERAGRRMPCSVCGVVKPAIEALSTPPWDEARV